MLGTDTIAVERFARSPLRIEGDVVTRTPCARLAHYVATVGSDGAVTRFESSSQFLEAQPAAAGPGALPLMNSYSFVMQEQAVRWMMAKGLNRATVNLLFSGARRSLTTPIARRGRDSVSIDFFGDPRLARIDDQGRLLGVDGSRTTVKVRVARVAGAGVDIDALARASAERDAAGKGLGQLSRRESVRETIGGATLVVDYGRPLQRGRVIFGGLVP